MWARVPGRVVVGSIVTARKGLRMVKLGNRALAGVPAAMAGHAESRVRDRSAQRRGAGRVRKLLIVGVSALALSTAACAGKEKTTIGAVGGGTAGGLIAAAAGGSPAWIAAGTILGILAGGAIGNALDNADREAAYRAQQDAMERQQSGQTTTWSNPDSGHSGTFTPQPAYQDSSTGQYCREFQQTITVDGKTESAYGTACRQDDGSWKIKDKT